jgi:hypothetical protein
MAHRLVWAFCRGAWPGGFIDHSDGNKANNRIENLRVATKAENGCNRGAAKNNALGMKGVTFHRQSGLYMVQVTLHGKRVYAKCFKTPDEAQAAYREASKLYHGEFARAS